MKLIAESGSTKTDWVLLGINGREEFRCQTNGMNPFYRSMESMVSELEQHHAITKIRSWVEQIHFFGSGCSQLAQQETIKSALSQVFKNAVANVSHDVNAAGLACLGTRQGYVGILGTGSVLGYFEEGDCKKIIGGYGYSLGDEAGGCWFGTQVLRAHVYGLLPKELESDFVATYPLSRAEILNRLYKQEMANTWLAGFARFLSKHREHSFVQRTLDKGFTTFIDTHLAAVKQGNEVHFVGSIAVHFERELQKALLAKDYVPGKILTAPIEGLVSYFGKA